MRRIPWALVILATTLSLAFLGLRGLFDPDEGRYVNVALNMLDSGDWVHPRRNDEVGHWTKPPVTYWAIASSMATFGRNAWAARLPSALAYLACVALVWLMARRLIPESRQVAAIVFATMLLPFGASQLITTDFLLAASQALALWAFVEARFGPTAKPRRWMVLMSAAFAIGFMIKGPPALLGLLPVLAFDSLQAVERSRRAFQWLGLLVFAAIALPWYLVVVTDTPGLLGYFLHSEVVGRVTSESFGRNPQWYGWIAVYVPTLLLGTLPWTATLWRWVRRLPASVRTWRDPVQRNVDQVQLLLASWVLLPLIALCFSRSRLPLYVLPLFVPLALLVARQLQIDGRAVPRWPWLIAWAGVLMCIKFAGVVWPTEQNSAAWADTIRARVRGPVDEVLFLQDKPRYGLRMHLGAEIETISEQPDPLAARFNPRYDQHLVRKLDEGGDPAKAVWICRQEDWLRLRNRIDALGFKAEPLGEPYAGRVIFRVSRAPASVSASMR